MADTFKDMIMRGIRRDVLLNLLKKGLRFDNRKFDELRPAELKKACLTLRKVRLLQDWVDHKYLRQ